VSALACYNIKGGVGKTATAVNLAWCAAEEGWRTVVWDLDPQGAASFYFRIEQGEGEGAEIVRRAKRVGRRVKATNHTGIDLVAADLELRDLELALSRSTSPLDKVARAVDRLREHYEVVIIDAPPGLSLVAENIFRAVNALVIPTIPTTLSLRTLDQLNRFIHEQGGKRRPELLPFFSMVDRRKHLHRLILETPSRSLPAILGSSIPYSAEIERMGITRDPVGAYAPKGQAISAYRALWSEIGSRIKPG
jgi:chromosome partitioning protein